MYSPGKMFAIICAKRNCHEICHYKWYNLPHTCNKPFIFAGMFEQDGATLTYWLSQGFVKGEEIVFILFLPHFTSFSKNTVL